MADRSDTVNRSAAVRRASADDLDVLTPMFDAYRKFYGQPEDLQLSRAFLSARLLGNDSAIFIAEVAATAAGFVQLYPSFSSVSCRRLWILNDLYVNPAWRRRGVGRQLMMCARTFAESTAAKSLTLETGCDNLQAQALYTELGYRREEETYHYALLLPEAAR